MTVFDPLASLTASLVTVFESFKLDERDPLDDELELDFSFEDEELDEGGLNDEDEEDAGDLELDPVFALVASRSAKAFSRLLRSSSVVALVDELLSRLADDELDLLPEGEVELALVLTAAAACSLSLLSS